MTQQARSTRTPFTPMTQPAPTGRPGVETLPRSGVAGVTRLSSYRAGHGPVAIALTQGTLALDLDLHPAMPHSPELRVVTGTPEQIGSWASRFAQALVEVIAGDRNPHQLLRCTSYDVQSRLVQRMSVLNAVARPEQRRLRLRAQVRSVHVQQPDPGTAEVSVHVRQGGRSRAIAARIELLEDRWVCVALELG
jgi:hypothetical protein